MVQLGRCITHKHVQHYNCIEVTACLTRGAGKTKATHMQYGHSMQQQQRRMIVGSAKQNIGHTCTTVLHNNYNGNGPAANVPYASRLPANESLASPAL